MAVYKVNVSLPPELVAAIDHAAAEQGLTRSGFIAEASARYVTELETLAAEEERKASIDRAIANMKEHGKSLPKDVDYLKIIRDFRERDGWDGPSE